MTVHNVRGPWKIYYNIAYIIITIILLYIIYIVMWANRSDASTGLKMPSCVFRSNSLINHKHWEALNRCADLNTHWCPAFFLLQRMRRSWYQIYGIVLDNEDEEDAETAVLSYRLEADMAR